MEDNLIYLGIEIEDNLCSIPTKEVALSVSKKMHVMQSMLIIDVILNAEDSELTVIEKFVNTLITFCLTNEIFFTYQIRRNKIDDCIELNFIINLF